VKDPCLRIARKQAVAGDTRNRTTGEKEVMQMEENNRYRTNTIRSQEGVISLEKQDGL